MKRKLIIAATLFLTIVTSCKDKQTVESDFTLADLSEFKTAEAEKLNSTTDEKQQIPVGQFNGLNADSSVSHTLNNTATHIDWDKKIIKTANLRLQIKDFNKYNAFVQVATKQHGGYIAQEQQSLSDDKSETNVTIKVPIAQFENLMNQLPAKEAKVLERSISTEDVSGEMVDTRSRLEAKKQMRIKYLEFLKQSKNMTEVLQVQQEINSIQEQIESAMGRINFLSHQTAYSTIQLNFFQPMEGYRPTDLAPSFITKVAESFKSGMRWFTELLIALIALWPLLILAGGGYLVWKNTKRKKLIPQKSICKRAALVSEK